jgi:hypothetical protein
MQQFVSGPIGVINGVLNDAYQEMFTAFLALVVGRINVGQIRTVGQSLDKLGFDMGG